MRVESLGGHSAFDGSLRKPPLCDTVYMVTLLRVSLKVT